MPGPRGPQPGKQSFDTGVDLAPQLIAVLIIHVEGDRSDATKRRRSDDEIKLFSCQPAGLEFRPLYSHASLLVQSSDLFIILSPW